VTGIIEHGGLRMRKDHSGRWVVTRDADRSRMVFPGSASAEALRRKLYGRRRDADEPTVVIGNCGRPADQSCGLKNPAECAVHAKAGGWDGGDGGTGDWDGREARMQRKIAKAKRARLSAPLKCAGDNETDHRLHIANLRAKHNIEKPRAVVVAADCAYRFRRW
jgi:hypothetical protein